MHCQGVSLPAHKMAVKLKINRKLINGEKPSAFQKIRGSCEA